MRMDIRSRRAALALAAFAALVLWAVRFAGRPPARPAQPTQPTQPSPAVVVPAPPPPVPSEAKPRRKIIKVPKAVRPPHAERGTRLRDPGEALGGKPPVRVDLSTPTVQ